MNLNLYRQFLWHLLYTESLLEANLDSNVDEENVKALATSVAQKEGILTNILKTGGSSCLPLSCMWRKNSFLFAVWRNAA